MKLIIILLTCMLVACVSNPVVMHEPDVTTLTCPDVVIDIPPINITIESPDVTQCPTVASMPPDIIVSPCHLEKVSDLYEQHEMVRRMIDEAHTTKDQEKIIIIGLAWINTSKDLIDQLAIEYIKCH